jgi:hypothetical protein
MHAYIHMDFYVYMLNPRNSLFKITLNRTYWFCFLPSLRDYSNYFDTVIYPLFRKERSFGITSPSLRSMEADQIHYKA